MYRYLCEEDHDCVIIHEVFDGQAPLEKGERELDKAMLARHSTIVIEPHQLGGCSVLCVLSYNFRFSSQATELLSALFGAVYFWDLCASCCDSYSSITYNFGPFTNRC